MTPLAAAIGSIPAFSSRTFIPLFVGAMLLRFGPEFLLVPELGLLAATGVQGATPTWFTHDITLIVLGLLACGEVAGEKQPEIRGFLNEIDQYVKPIAAMVAAAGYLSVADREFVEQQIGEAGAADWIVTLGFAGSVFAVAHIRSALHATLAEFDEDDDLGLQKYLSWLEDAWSATGILAAVLFPVLMMVLAAAGVVGLIAVRRVLEKREAARRVPCAACGTAMHAAAGACPECGLANPEPKRVNWLGVAGRRAAGQGHPLRLATFRRCGRCAERLPARKAPQECPACGEIALADAEAVRAFNRTVRLRLPVTLLVTTGLSLVPVIGLIPAVIYSRLSIVAPYRRYIPRVHAIWLRLALRALLAVSVAIQFIPLIGAVGIPLSALASHAAYRAAFRRLAA